MLVRVPNHLGDALMARPFLRALRAGAPAARITAVGPEPLLALLGPDRHWDDTVAWPLAPQAWPALCTPRADAAFVLPPSFSSAYFAWRSGARERVGWPGEGRSPLLTRVVRRPAHGELHLAGEYLALLGIPAGLPAALDIPPFAPTADGERQAEELLGGPEAAARPFAVLAPGAIYGPAKRWPLDSFLALARQLEGRGLRIVACGGAAEGGTCAALVRAAGGDALSLAGRTSLAGQAALCRRAAVVVSNDSGMAHLAAAVGAPAVAIFGSTSSAWTAPLGPAVVVVQRPPVCSPCFARTCRIGYLCLKAVDVDSVVGAAERALAAGAGGHAA